MHILILYLNYKGSVTASENKLLLKTCCPDPSDVTLLTFECSVIGRPVGSTVWRGSAFDCPNEEIVLLHSLFMSKSGSYGMCNNGSIVGRGLRSENGCYTSQLNVTVTPDMIGKSIECVHDDITSTSTVGTLNIFKPDENINFI